MIEDKEIKSINIFFINFIDNRMDDVNYMKHSHLI